MLSSVEQAFVGREEIRAPLKAPAWEASHLEGRGGNGFDTSVNVIHQQNV